MANSRLLSRWYPGAGLYRNVHLIVNEDVHIPMWGTQLSTPVVKNDFARVRLNTSLVMPEGKSSSSYRIVTEIKNAVGSVVCKGEKQLTDFDGQTFSQEFVVEKLELQSPTDTNPHPRMAIRPYVRHAPWPLSARLVL